MAVGPVAIVWWLQTVPSPVAFSCHAISSDEPSNVNEAETTSMSPSPSTSAARTERVNVIPVAIVWSVQSEPSPATFSCQPTSSVAERTSRSPSPSTSAAWTHRAPLASAEIG